MKRYFVAAMVAIFLWSSGVAAQQISETRGASQGIIVDPGDPGGGGSGTSSGTPASSFKNDVAHKRTSINITSSSGAVSIVYDRSTDRVYINTNGWQIDRSLTEVAQAAFAGDTAGQSAFKAKIRADATNMLYWSEGYTSASNSTSLMTRRARQSLMASGPGYGSCVSYYSSLDWNCYYEDYPYGMFGFTIYDVGSGDYRDYDYYNWDQARWKACNHQSTAWLAYASALSGGTYACVKAAATKTVPDIAACVVAVPAVLATRAELVNDNRLCSMTEYPGYMRW